ncbi:DNA-binding FadR family transcriptional regulator [Caldalkalibacillus uzonensis]|uniref:DNA-binding FadR family transcriptional regulator n=2 Tax=Caldalkalibacillus uzonensis TaxID=353224 RepID=A0ABU0CPH7_9BACI|nr:DNA-binding FadR family transcriptional regulator [Caldalkalibacillus uzonensis]
MFSVSRGAVREAISVLAERGIVTVKPGIGIFLNNNDQDQLFVLFDSIFHEGKADIFELLELRQGIESYASFYAAQRRTEEDLRRIKAALDQMEHSINRHELAVKEDFAFHSAVIEASHNSMMINTFKLISDTAY